MFELTPYFHNRHNRSLNVYDPWRAFDDIERSFFGERVHTFSTDVADNGDSYTVETDLPGFKKEDIKIEIAGDTMTVNAERHSDFEKEEKKDKYVRVERSYGSYSRTFDITGIEASGIKAKYDNGVLTLTLPKKAAKAPETRRLTIE
ncbi:MAG: Hsp20/alpha crystallin family protein [Clostridia bacterium]|nr:Hsp20/alpha crystallin family protein [Clostridia bacterium]